MSAIQSTVRVKSFDVLKLFAIFLVLWGHSIQYFISGDFIDKPIYVYIYSFHMPLFMMISGYFSLSSMNLPVVVFIKKKIVQLLLPWLSWGICMVTVNFIYSLLNGYTFSLIDVTSMIVYTFWFLKSLFLCYLLAYFGLKFLSNSFLMVVVTIGITQIIHYYNMPILYPCFLLGIYLKLKDALWQDKIVYCLSFSLLIFITLLCFWNKSFWDYKVFNFTSFFIKNENYPLIYLYRELYRILIGLTGSLSFIFLFYFFFKWPKQSKVFDICCEWGKYTLGVYILQTIILETIMAKIINLDYLGFISFNFFVAPLLSIAVLIICVLIVKIINKYRILRFLLLGKS